jgi:hypothetical protein
MNFPGSTQSRRVPRASSHRALLIFDADLSAARADHLRRQTVADTASANTASDKVPPAILINGKDEPAPRCAKRSDLPFRQGSLTVAL